MQNEKQKKNKNEELKGIKKATKLAEE